MSYLMILNDPPYGTERTYNGLRLALNLLKKAEGIRLTVFLMGDAASAAKAGQQTPNGYYNLERMLKGVLTKKGAVLLCGPAWMRGASRTQSWSMAAAAARSTSSPS